MPSIPDIPEAPTVALLDAITLLASASPKLHLSQIQLMLTVGLMPRKTQKELSLKLEMAQSSVSHHLAYFLDLDWMSYEGIIGAFIPVRYSLTAKGATFVRMAIQSMLEYKAFK